MTERFTLLTEIGRGGMGVVWKARDEESGSIVALKLLRETYAEDPEYLERFERELELARRIDSIHVVNVLGYGVRKKVPYLALEYVDGSSLHDALRAHGPYDWAQVRALLIQLAQGLADAHAARVIHRDVKPSNVLIGPDGIAKLTDFGIARGVDLTRMTATSTMLGTPAYLAPEGPKDARSDLYSLGIIGYEMLAGAVPFKGTTYQEVIIDHIRTPPDLARLPAEARPIVGWLLAKDPAERPQRASELLAVLWSGAQVPVHFPAWLATQGLVGQVEKPAGPLGGTAPDRPPLRLPAGPEVPSSGQPVYFDEHHDLQPNPMVPPPSLSGSARLRAGPEASAPSQPVYFDEHHDGPNPVVPPAERSAPPHPPQSSEVPPEFTPGRLLEQSRPAAPKPSQPVYFDEHHDGPNPMVPPPSRSGSAHRRARPEVPPPGQPVYFDEHHDLQPNPMVPPPSQSVRLAVPAAQGWAPDPSLGSRGGSSPDRLSAQAPPQPTRSSDD